MHHLRMRNQFVIQARSNERLHAVTLHVHIRGQDVGYFNRNSSTRRTEEDETKSDGGVNYVEHLLELLDDDSDFQLVIQELDVLRTTEDMGKINNKSGAMKNASSQWMKVQWRILEQQQNHRSLANVLQFAHKRRQECFTREAGEKPTKAKRSQDAGDEVYVGGMYKPLPMRKLAIEAWIYPPHVVFPATGDRIPVDDSSVTDFFHDVDVE